MTLVLQTPQLTSRALVLAKIEDAVTMAAGGDALPSPLTDAILVGVPEVKPEVDLLQRTFARLSLSPVASSIGRKRTSVTFSAATLTTVLITLINPSVVIDINCLVSST